MFDVSAMPSELLKTFGPRPPARWSVRTERADHPIHARASRSPLGNPVQASQHGACLAT